MLNKIDIRPILRAHLATLRDNRFGDRPSLGDAALFFGLPVALAATVMLFGFRFRVDAVNGFLNVFSILTGLLLILLVLVITPAAGRVGQQANQQRRLLLIKEIFANVCFSVLIAIFVVCAALVALSYMRSSSGATTGPGATFLLASLTANLVLNLLLVLKRMYILLSKELDGDSTGQSRVA